MTRMRAPLAAVAAAAVLLAGCSPAEPSAPAPPEGVTVAIVQQRSDVAERMAQVRVYNGSDEAFAFAAVRVDDGRFAASVDLEADADLAPGRTVDLRFALPEVACDDPDELRTVVFGLPDGGELAVDLTGAEDFTRGLHERECLMRDIERTASLAWTAFEPSAPGEPAHAMLTATPTGSGDPVEFAGIRSTNLLRFRPRDGEFWRLALGLDAASPVTGVEVPLVPQRCDPHVVQEDKRGTIFTIDVDLPREGTVELAMPPELKARVLTWVAEWCEFGR